MSRRITEIITSDLSGEADAHTVSFAFEGISYELDLTAAEGGEMGEFLARYISVARRIGGHGRRRSTARAATRSENLAEVRQWAAENGYEVSDRGRISKQVAEAYQAAHAG